MSNIIEISPVTRIEGHAKIALDTDENGIVKNAYFLSTSMVRGFEYLVRGRNFEFANIVVQRICGICPVPHGLASVEAVEDAMGVEIPKDAMILRELLLIANKMHSHALHQYLILDDVVKDSKVKNETVERIQEIRRLSQKIADVVGGEAIHPSNIRVGGMRSNITPYAAAMLYRVLRKCEHVVKLQKDFMIDVLEQKMSEIPLSMGRYNGAVLATDMTYGNKNKFDISAVTEVTPYRYYKQTDAGKDTNIMIPLYYGEIVEVGPRARFSKYKKFNGDSALHINVARAREMMILVYKAVELLDELSTKGAVFKEYNMKKGAGIGVIEAARGTNIHSINVDKLGRVEKYNIIAPTTWNMPVIEKAIEGNHHQYAELIVRSFDPCVECATHQIVIRDMEGNITGRRIFR
ncbi:MAG: coenzyme F420 hydrogenase subunit alpha [Candidatus Methanofastidiosia archaeon]